MPAGFPLRNTRSLTPDHHQALLVPAPAPPARRQAAQHIGALTSVKHPFAIGPFLVEAPSFPAREFTHRWVGHHRIHVGHLLPQLPWRPAHRVLYPVVLGYVAPAVATTNWAEQLFKKLVADHQHRIGLDHQLGSLIRHASGLELLAGEQVQEVLPAIALDALLRVGRAAKLPPLWPPRTARGSFDHGGARAD